MRPRIISRLRTLGMMARALARQPALLVDRPEYVFVLSHMRSNTSLLSHLLGSHPEISGHSELGLSYRHGLDLLKLRCKVYLDNHRRLAERYILDKILHDDLVIRPSILARPELRLLFIVREPEQTLRSILHMGAAEARPDWKREPARVADYYCQRLAQLGAYFHALGAATRRRRCIFLRAEDLLADPQAELARLSAWLDLRQPLKPEYRVFDSTGRPGFGDPLGPIKAGRIIARQGDYGHIALDPGLLPPAREAYARFLALWAEPAELPALPSAAAPAPLLARPRLAAGGQP